MEWLVQGKTERMVALFSHLGTRPDLSLSTLFDGGIRGFMQQVGAAWSEETLRVSDEHVASQCLVDALLGARALRAAVGNVATRRDPSELPLLAVVGAMEGNEQFLGSLCIRLLLESMGHGGSAVEYRRGPAGVRPGGGPFDLAPAEHPFRVLETFGSSDDFAHWMATGSLRSGGGGTA